MKRTSKRTLWTGVLILCMGLMSGCAGKAEETAAPALAGNEAAAQENGGTLILKVNPEIAVEYDENGRVTSVTGRNEDGRKIAESYQDYIGKECHEAVEELVSLIHEAGYFVEEVEGESRKITIEIETGSILPEEDFVDEIVTGVQTYVKDMQINSPVVAEDQNGDGMTDFDIYEHHYGNESYEIVVPPENPAQEPETKPADAAAGENAGGTDAENPAPETEPEPPMQDRGTGTTPNVNPPVRQESPYTDYETPYTEASPYTNYETPYTEASPYTDYETPYTEVSPYTDYETPYTEASPYTDYASPYSDYSHESSHYGDSGYSHYH